MTKGYQQRFSLSILLWMRQDKTRQAGLLEWRACADYRSFTGSIRIPPATFE